MLEDNKCYSSRKIMVSNEDKECWVEALLLYIGCYGTFEHVCI